MLPDITSKSSSYGGGKYVVILTNQIKTRCYKLFEVFYQRYWLHCACDCYKCPMQRSHDAGNSIHHLVLGLKKAGIVEVLVAP